MMRFFKMFRSDLSHGLGSMWKVFPLEMLVGGFIVYDFWRRAHVFQNGAETLGTLGDIALYTFGGMKKYVPSLYDPFQFPTLWMLLFALVCFSTLWYPFHDLHGFGKNLLVFCQSRRIWYLSKCLWCICIVTLQFLLLWSVLLAGCGAVDLSYSFQISPYMAEIFELPEMFSVLDRSEILWPLLLGPWLTGLSLSLLQLAASIYFSPILGFCFSGTILITSAYYASPFLLGNYGMIIRDDHILPGGMSFVAGMEYNFFVSAIFILVGAWLFRRYDILGKGELRQE